MKHRWEYATIGIKGQPRPKCQVIAEIKPGKINLGSVTFPEWHNVSEWKWSAPVTKRRPTPNPRSEKAFYVWTEQMGYKGNEYICLETEVQ